MVLSDPEGKAQQERGRTNFSPSRERGRRKPRRGWLVAVGQGQSPASTRSRRDDSSSSSPNKRSKKIDVDSLTFSGLEEQQDSGQSVQPQSPSGASTHPSSPRWANSAPRNREPGTPQTDDTTAGQLGSPNSSILAYPACDRGSGEHEAATRTATEGGCEGKTGAAGIGRSPVKSPLLLSPGKDYWTGRIAAGQTSPQGSESPRRAGTRRKNKMASNAGSPGRNFESGSGGGGVTPAPGPFSPGSSTWSTEAFSPGARLPISPASLTHRSGGGKDSFSASARAALGRVGSSMSLGWSPSRGAANQGFCQSRPGSQGFSLSSFRQGGPSLSPGASSVGSRAPPFGSIPGRDPLGSSFGRASRSVSPMRRQVAREARSGRGAAVSVAATGRVLSPSSLPRRSVGSDGRVESPERTSPPSHSPERTGVTFDERGGGADGDVSSPRRGWDGAIFASGSGSSQPEDAAAQRNSAAGGVKPLGSPSATRPSPLKSPQSVSMSTPPQRRSGDRTNDAEADDRGGEVPSAEQPRSPLREDNRVAPKNVHAPPGVLTEAIVTGKLPPRSREASSSTEATSCGAGKAGGGRGRGASADLRVSTPTGDGGSSDLSLWVTIRRHEDAGDMGGFSSCSPASSVTPVTVLGTDLGTDLENRRGGIAGLSGVGGESLPRCGGARMPDEMRGGKPGGGLERLEATRREGRGGEEAPWHAWFRELWKIFDFCRPSGGDDDD